MTSKEEWYGLWCVEGEGGCGELYLDDSERTKECPNCGERAEFNDKVREFTIRFEDTAPYGKILRVIPKNWKHNTRVSVRGEQGDLKADLRYDGKQDWAQPLIEPITTEITHDI